MLKWRAIDEVDIVVTNVPVDSDLSTYSHSSQPQKYY